MIGGCRIGRRAFRLPALALGLQIALGAVAGLRFVDQDVTHGWSLAKGSPFRSPEIKPEFRDLLG